MPEPTPILEVEDIAVSFGGIHAVAGATFEVAPGSVTALIGPNGAGKTTAFNLITGFVRPDRGTVRFKGADITGKRPDQIAARGLVRTFQLTKVFSKMTVRDNVALAASGNPGEGFSRALFQPRSSRRAEADARRRADQILTEVGLARMADEYAGTLSGGQRKLLELARVLMNDPDLLLLDEPMAGVNPTLGRELVTLLLRLRDERNLTYLFVEHNIDLVMEISEQVVVMALGEVISVGPPDHVRGDPKVIDAYLGSEVEA